jgi:thiol-disulfide isomerase/thioredoxin
VRPIYIVVIVLLLVGTVWGGLLAMRPRPVAPRASAPAPAVEAMLPSPVDAPAVIPATKPAVTPVAKPAAKPPVASVKKPAAVKPAPRPAPPKALPTLLEFGATWCPYCVKMEPVIAELRQASAGKLTVRTVDTDQEQALAEQYGIRAIPVQVLLNAEGTEIWRNEGYLPLDRLRAGLTATGLAL